jgi:hypothetical protein
MELAELAFKWGAVFVALGTVIGALIGARSYARFLKKAAHMLLFMKYTERYEQIMSSYPDEALPARLDLEGELPEPSAPLTLAVLRYLNLCSEEYYLWQKGYIEDKVWKIWEAELNRTLASPLYRREWQKLQKEFHSYPEFRDYVDRVQKQPSPEPVVVSVERAKPISR